VSHQLTYEDQSWLVNALGGFDRMGKYVFVAGLCIVILLTVFTIISPFIAPSQSIAIETSAIHHDSGFAFAIPLRFSLPFPFEVAADDFGSEGSDLQLMEDNRPLGPAHTLHDAIRTLGKGRYSHWRQDLRFSTSDNTDPRTNGRRYDAIAKARLSNYFIGVVLFFDFGFIALFYRRLSAPLFRYAPALGAAFALAAIGAAGLLAAGVFRPITLDIAGPTDSALVIDTVRHAFFGCLLTLLQWAAGVGIALVITGDNRASFGRIALLGFPLSLILLTVFVAISLALPLGAPMSAAVLGACLLPLFWWHPQPKDLVRASKVILAIMPLAVIFGCWWGLLAHGPTSTLYGRPSGDVVFYASSIPALRLHHFPMWYLGNEGEQFLPFNMLFPAIGSTLVPYIRLDPFLFILAAGGSSYVLSLGIALYAFLSERVSHRPDTLAMAVTGLGVIAAGRYPYWTVESIPVVFAIPLTLAIWYQVRESKSPWGIISNFSLAVVGSALSKVSSAATLAPLALTPFLEQMKVLRKPVRLVGAIIAAISAAYVLLMVVKFGWLMIDAAPIGPESYTNWQYGAAFDLPFFARDFGALLLIFLAYRVTPWPIASSLALGLTFALIFSFFMRINFACAGVVLGLIFVENGKKRKSDKFLALSAYGLCVPAMLMTDFGGYPSSVFWLLCVGGTVWIALEDGAAGPSNSSKIAWSMPTTGFRMIATVSIVAALCLVAVGRGRIALDPGGRNADLQISPDARDIWLAVRQRTASEALIFTDQTGPEPGLLTGWNTFALSGKRQVYLAGWYQSGQLRGSPAKRAERLAINDDVLSGHRPPTALTYSRNYGSYFAVVNRDRAMPMAWNEQYANSTYALYQYNPNR
jgi:hypothetical protein